MQEFRSSQSTHRDRASLPTTTAVLTPPLCRNCPAVTVAKRNPLHAAVRSKATQFVVAPIAAATLVASPKRSSGLEVATMTRSTSLPLRPLAASAAAAASAARFLMPTPPSFVRMRRWLMPVRVAIHSSEVSTTDSRSELVTTVAGAADPVPRGRQLSLPPPAMPRAVVDVRVRGAVVPHGAAGCRRHDADANRDARVTSRTFIIFVRGARVRPGARTGTGRARERRGGAPAVCGTDRSEERCGVVDPSGRGRGGAGGVEWGRGSTREASEDGRRKGGGRRYAGSRWRKQRPRMCAADAPDETATVW
mmetsp:Transcript_21129/g.42299  ORF Transcript_21129/g.42299 Transcript_21129/m.42299 type:complete len:307 (+) Transcript_21129:543-1463(+)